MKVAARTSAFSFKGKNANVSEIGEKLGVKNVLEGSVRKSGSKLRISVQLVNAADGYQLWSESYDREMEDIFDVQDEIALAVVDALKVKLFGDEQEAILKRYKNNAEAYQLYLRGRFFFSQRTPEGFKKALELDPNMAEAHTSLAFIVFNFESDFAGAEKSYKRAIELNPNYTTTRYWYAMLLSVSSRHDEAIREMTKAFELEPFSFATNHIMVLRLRYAGRLDEALLQIKKANELFPSDTRFHNSNSNIYADLGKYDQAVEEYLLYAKANKDFKTENVAKLKEAYEKGGWDAYGRVRQEIRLEQLNAKLAKDPNGYVKALHYAEAYAWGKDKDKTIEYLNKMYDELGRELLDLKVEKGWDFVRDDPRFKELVRRVGIPE